MLVLNKTKALLATLWLMLFTLGSAQQLKINYYNNNYCGNYVGELKYCKIICQVSSTRDITLTCNFQIGPIQWPEMATTASTTTMGSRC